MNQERIAILRMLEEGKISVDDAAALLEAIEKAVPADRPQAAYTTSAERGETPVSRFESDRKAPGRSHNRKTPRVRGKSQGRGPQRTPGRSHKRMG